MPLTGIRIYAVSTVVRGEDVRLSAVRVSNYQLTVTEADGTTVHFVGIIRVAPRCEVVSRPCVTTTPSSQNKAFANIVATMLRGADGQGVDDVYVDERGYIHIILEDGKDVSCELTLPKYYTKEEVGELYATIESLSKKQDKIADLATIRSGAEKGTTAVQPSDIAKVAKSGSYADLSGKPTFKTVNGESVVGEGNIEIQGGSGGADLAGYATEDYVNQAVANVDVRGEDGYVYSNGEKVDMRFTRSLIPVGVSIPAKANLNNVAYLKVGKYYCSLNADAKTITNCPTSSAFMMEVFNPLSTVVDNEVDTTHVYRIRILTEYSTGIQYVQYCTVGSTANNWTYDSWYVIPRTKFTLNSSKNDGSAALGSATAGVYIDATGTFKKMTYTLGKSVPSSAVFTDTKVTAVANHYTPTENTDAQIEAPSGQVVKGVKRDAAGHIVGLVTTPYSGGEGSGSSAKVYHLNESLSASGTLSQEAYDGVMSADIVTIAGSIADKVDNGDGSAILVVHSSSANIAITITLQIASDKTYTYTSEFFVIPTKVSDLENDSKYLTIENLADVAVMAEKFGEGKYAFTNGISDGELIYAVPTSANGDEDDVLVTRSTLCTINGDGIFNNNGSSNLITHPLQKRMSIVPGQSTVLVPSYNIFVDNPVVGLITINFPTPLSAAKQTRCSISFLTGASALTINYGATIWWANGDSPSIEANTMYEMTFVWNAVANAWLGVYGKFKA